MMPWLETAVFWHWWVLAVVLMIVEVFAPGAVFIWMGVAAGVVGLILWIFPATPWEAQWTIFALMSVASIVAFQFYLRRNPTATDRPRLNRRGQQYVDRVFVLAEPIENGFGKIRVDDSTWKISGPDCPAGTKVRVHGVDGVVLQVRPVD